MYHSFFVWFIGHVMHTSNSTVLAKLKIDQIETLR